MKKNIIFSLIFGFLIQTNYLKTMDNKTKLLKQISLFTVPVIATSSIWLKIFKPKTIEQKKPKNCKSKVSSSQIRQIKPLSTEKEVFQIMSRSN